MLSNQSSRNAAQSQAEAIADIPSLEAILPKLKPLKNVTGPGPCISPNIMAIAAYYLGVLFQPDARELSRGNNWNKTIDALDDYDPDWRGYRPAYLQGGSAE